MLAEIINGINIDNTINDILKRMHRNGPIDPKDLEALSYIKKCHPEILKKYESKIMYLMGLFYKVEAPKNLFEEVYSIFSDTIEEDTGYKFSPVQADAYHKIHDNSYFSFSAPTSTGKSHLFRQLILNCKGDIVIVVPSRALIAEYMSVVLEILSDNNEVLVLQFIDNININKVSRRVFIITPERGNVLFEYANAFNIELFLLDEAQIVEEKIRGMSFDAFVRRIFRRFPSSKKVFAHPFVENPEAQLKRHNITTDCDSITYKQNAVGKVFLMKNKNDFFYFSPYSKDEEVKASDTLVEDILNSKKNILIYASKSKLYNKEFLREYGKYLSYCPKIKNPSAIKLIEELREYIGANKEGVRKQSILILLMEHGIVLHHGSMPLKARFIIENFIKSGFAKICFATSTLLQGINMPFDVVIIDNFRFPNKNSLTLKNLIGRSGRTTLEKSNFDFGLTIIHKRNKNTFCERIQDEYYLSEKSELDNDIEEVSEDEKDIVEALKHDTFNDEYRMTDCQLIRMKTDDNYKNVKFILDSLITNDRVLKGNEYYNLEDKKRNKIKEAFKSIFVSHLRRDSLNRAEQSVLSASIPILLWHIQGKSFKEVMILRYYYLSQEDEQKNIRAIKDEFITSEYEISKEISKLKIRYSPVASSLPKFNLTGRRLFPKELSVTNIDYDTLVFDTYDYIDKVINLSLSDPLCAAFELYYNEFNDYRALAMSNYIRYATNDSKEIWLLRYGFSFEDIKWIKNIVAKIDENEIKFNDEVKDLSEEKFKTVSRYL